MNCRPYETAFQIPSWISCFLHLSFKRLSVSTPLRVVIVPCTAIWLNSWRRSSYDVLLDLLASKSTLVSVASVSTKQKKSVVLTCFWSLWTQWQLLLQLAFDCEIALSCDQRSNHSSDSNAKTSCLLLHNKSHIAFEISVFLLMLLMSFTMLLIATKW